MAAPGLAGAIGLPPPTDIGGIVMRHFVMRRVAMRRVVTRRLGRTVGMGAVAAVLGTGALVLPGGTAGASALAVTTPSLPPAAVGTPFSQTLTASGGVPAYTWAVTSGAPCPGVTLSPAGLLAGTPTAGGSYPLTVTATDSSGATATAGYVLDCAPGSSPVSTETEVSGGQNSLCIDPTGVTLPDGAPAPPTIPATLACNPPASLASLASAVPVTSVPGSYATIPGTTWVGYASDASDTQYPPPAAENDNRITVYDAEFTLPACYGQAALRGSMLADNAAAAYLSNGLIGAQSTLNGGPATNFTGPATPLAYSGPLLHSGTNVLDFVVEDHSTPYTGLDFSVSVTYTAGRCGTVKVCKVAGFGIATGTPFTFHVTTLSGTTTVTVPAGPAPGGFCQVADATAPGGPLTVTEVRPPGVTVSAINADFPGLTNLITATWHGIVHVGMVTEVTFEDQALQGAKTGTLEICKQVLPGPAAPPAAFHMTVDGHPVTVPTGACTAAITVPAGVATVVEPAAPPWAMASCSTIPAPALLSCNPTGGTATVSVPAGGVRNETILTVTNGPPNATGGGSTGSAGTPGTA